MEAPKGWTRKKADDFLDEIEGSLASLGVSARIVGSVATIGVSANDLDIVLKPLKAMTLDEIISTVESQLLPKISNEMEINPTESGHNEDEHFLPIVLLDGRLVEFYLAESDFPQADWDFQIDMSTNEGKKLASLHALTRLAEITHLHIVKNPAGVPLSGQILAVNDYGFLQSAGRDTVRIHDKDALNMSSGACEALEVGAACEVKYGRDGNSILSESEGQNQDNSPSGCEM